MIRRENKSSKGKGFLAGAIIGAVIGSAAALLLAPKSGKETQEQLKQKAKKIIKKPDVMVTEMEADLENRIDSLKVAARDLHGEAYEESQRLITRAEILRNDLEDSASRLALDGKDPEMSDDAKRLVNEGQAVIDELERMTRQIMSIGTQSGQDDGDRR